MVLSPEQVVCRYYDLFNARRFDEAERLVAPDALFRDPAFAQQLVGPAAHRTVSEHWLAPFPDLELDIKRAWTSGDGRMVVDSVARGTHRGVFRFGNLSLLPTGRRIRIDFQHHMRIRNGRIVEVCLELDAQELLRQMKAA